MHFNICSQPGTPIQNIKYSTCTGKSLQLSNTDWICAQWWKCDTGKSLEYTNVSNGIILFSDVIFFNHFLILRCLLSYCPSFSFASLVVVCASFTGFKNCWPFYQLQSVFGRSFGRLMRMEDDEEDVGQSRGVRKAENVRPSNRLKMFFRAYTTLYLFALICVQFDFNRCTISVCQQRTHTNRYLCADIYFWIFHGWFVALSLFHFHSPST